MRRDISEPIRIFWSKSALPTLPFIGAKVVLSFAFHSVVSSLLRSSNVWSASLFVAILFLLFFSLSPLTPRNSITMVQLQIRNNWWTSSSLVWQSSQSYFQSALIRWFWVERCFFFFFFSIVIVISFVFLVLSLFFLGSSCFFFRNLWSFHFYLFPLGVAMWNSELVDYNKGAHPPTLRPVPFARSLSCLPLFFFNSHAQDPASAKEMWKALGEFFVSLDWSLSLSPLPLCFYIPLSSSKEVSLCLILILFWFRNIVLSLTLSLSLPLSFSSLTLSLSHPDKSKIICLVMPL